MRASLSALVTIACFIVLGKVSPGQEKSIEPSKLPQVVQQAFERFCPSAQVLGASVEHEKGVELYEVECQCRGRHHDVTFRADGTLVSDEETIPLEEVPKAVQQALRKAFPGARVKRAEKVVEGGTVSYEFQLSGAAKKEAKFSAAGQMLEAQ